MARLFDGTNDSLVSASAIDLSSFNKLAISMWLWWDSFANDDQVALELSSNFNNVSTGFLVDPNEGVSGAFSARHKGDSNYSTGEFTRPSGGAWHQYVINLDKSLSTNEVVSIYLDGTSQSLSRSQNANNTNNYGSHTLYVMSRNNTTLWADGRMAELAIYGGVNLSQSDVTNLQTLKPDQVGSPSFGWHLDGTESPEPDFVGGVDLTVNGATFTDHPPVFASSGHPASRRIPKETLGLRPYAVRRM